MSPRSPRRSRARSNSSFSSTGTHRSTVSCCSRMQSGAMPMPPSRFGSAPTVRCSASPATSCSTSEDPAHRFRMRPRSLASPRTGCTTARRCPAIPSPDRGVLSRSLARPEGTHPCLEATGYTGCGQKCRCRSRSPSPRHGPKRRTWCCAIGLSRSPRASSIRVVCRSRANPLRFSYASPDLVLDRNQRPLTVKLSHIRVEDEPPTSVVAPPRDRLRPGRLRRARAGRATRARAVAHARPRAARVAPPVPRARASRRTPRRVACAPAPNSSAASDRAPV